MNFYIFVTGSFAVETYRNGKNVQKENFIEPAAQFIRLRISKKVWSLTSSDYFQF